MLAQIRSWFHPLPIGAAVHITSPVPVINPPPGGEGVRNYAGLTDLVGPTAARGLLRIFASPHPLILRILDPLVAPEQAAKEGARAVVSEIRREFKAAMEQGPNAPRQVADYLLVHAPIEQRRATLETGLAAILDECGIGLNELTEEAIAQEVVRLDGWIEDPQRLPIQMRTADDILDDVMERMFEKPNSLALRHLHHQIYLHLADITLERYGKEREHQALLAFLTFASPVEVQGLLAKSKGVMGFADPWRGLAYLERQYGFLMEVFTRFHEALHVADLMRDERIQRVVEAWGHPILTPVINWIHGIRRVGSEVAARYYEWQMAKKFFRGKEVLFLHEAVSVAMAQEEPEEVLAIAETYFRDLWNMANSSLFDYLVDSMNHYHENGVFRHARRAITRESESLAA